MKHMQLIGKRLAQKSPPARGRGLKPKRPCRVGVTGAVAPRAGAWIETYIIAFY